MVEKFTNVIQQTQEAMMRSIGHEVIENMDKLINSLDESGETYISPIPVEPRLELDEVTFKFTQDANCVDGGVVEELTIEAKSSGGISRDEGAFYVLRTEQWAINDSRELEELILKVDKAIKVFTK